MAASCDICGRSTSFGNNVSHAKNRVRRSWKINLKTKNVMKDGQKTRMRVCTRCIKSKTSLAV